MHSVHRFHFLAVIMFNIDVYHPSYYEGTALLQIDIYLEGFTFELGSHVTLHCDESALQEDVFRFCRDTVGETILGAYWNWVKLQNGTIVDPPPGSLMRDFVEPQPGHRGERWCRPMLAHVVTAASPRTVYNSIINPLRGRIGVYYPAVRVTHPGLDHSDVASEFEELTMRLWTPEQSDEFSSLFGPNFTYDVILRSGSIEQIWIRDRRCMEVLSVTVGAALGDLYLMERGFVHDLLTGVVYERYSNRNNPRDNWLPPNWGDRTRRVWNRYLRDAQR